MADVNETTQIAREGDVAAAEPAGIVAQPSPGAVETAPYVAPKRRPGLTIAILVLLLVAAVIATAFVLVANRRVSLADMRTLLELILGPLFALAGAVLGFYFANR